MGWSIRIDERSPVPIYEQIAEQVRQHVRTGRAAPGLQLPSVRDLAGHLAVNPLTIARAYVDLERGGFVVTRVGRGTFVAPEPPVMPEAERRRELERRVRQFVRENRWLIRSGDELRGMVEESL